ncbi:metallophosphoesterase [Paenibacillus spiritus]|uniref:Metallophosphoesterase n=1 Tax=Paenibacillus spiritus TaxID=2496557 RepID=A0A5J5GEH6_9BACL|nr:metallophosphoesterase [Paenibacillus spiritus]KAA9006609.1 metallophosphoesterase [Paenibacillus spiritus]
MKKLRFLLTALAAVAVLGAVNLYIGYHLLLLLDSIVPALPRALYWTVFLVVAMGYPLAMIPWPSRIRPFFRPFKVLGSYYLAVMEFALLLLPLADLVYGILRLAGADAAAYARIAGWVLAALLVAFLVWGSRNAWNTVLRKYPIAIEGDKSLREPLTVAVASDLHLGNIVGNRHLKRLVARINAMQPDLILLVGDVLDDSIEPFLRNRMSENLAKLKARHGVYAVLGNHEYYGGSIAEYTEVMKSIGIPVLQDEVAEAAGVYIVGRKDKTAETMDPNGRRSVADLLKGLDRSRPIILMDHQPTGFDAAAKEGVDLLLSGHTHRGQIAPNHWITRRLFELDWGYLRKAGLHVVVSSGYGTWGPPIRLASRSEILGLSLVTAQAR